MIQIIIFILALIVITIAYTMGGCFVALMCSCDNLVQTMTCIAIWPIVLLITGIIFTVSIVKHRAD